LVLGQPDVALVAEVLQPRQNQILDGVLLRVFAPPSMGNLAHQGPSESVKLFDDLGFVVDAAS